MKLHECDGCKYFDAESICEKRKSDLSCYCESEPTKSYTSTMDILRTVPHNDIIEKGKIYGVILAVEELHESKICYATDNKDDAIEFIKTTPNILGKYLIESSEEHKYSFSLYNKIKVNNNAWTIRFTLIELKTCRIKALNDLLLLVDELC